MRYAVTVLPGEFLLPGSWEVLSAPAEATAAVEERVKPLEIILRHPETSP
jgi:hypothetical protein